MLGFNLFDLGPIMSPHRKGSQNPYKAPVEEVPVAMDEEEEYIDMLGVVYDDTKCLIDKDTTFKWGEYPSLECQSKIMISKSLGPLRDLRFIRWKLMQQCSPIHKLYRG